MSIPVPDLYDPRVGGHLALIKRVLNHPKNVKDCQAYVKFWYKIIMS